MDPTVTETTSVQGADEPTSVAWAYFPEWSGPLDLVIRVARGAVQGARELGSPDPVCRSYISVYFSGDVERFESVDDLKTYVTGSAVKHFDHIDIRAGDPGEQPLVTVTFVKGGSVYAQEAPRSCPWLTRGVLVRTTPPSDSHRLLAGEVRDAVALAVSRGWNRTRTSAMSGETWADRRPELAVAGILSERRRTTQSGRTGNAIFVPVIMLGTALALTESGLVGDSLLEPDPSRNGDYIADTWDVLFLLAGGVFGWFVSAPLTKWVWAAWPSVAIGDRSPRVWRVTKWIGLALAGALASAAATALLLALGITTE